MLCVCWFVVFIGYMFGVRLLFIGLLVFLCLYEGVVVVNVIYLLCSVVYLGFCGSCVVLVFGDGYFCICVF